MEEKSRTGIISNLAWKFGERITAQVVTLIVTIILARLLEPEHYGVIAIVMVFISIANVFVLDGLGNSLIQKKDVDELDYSTVLVANLVMTFVLYILLYFSAPFISSFYGEGYEILTPVLRVLSFRIILSGINSVQQAYVAKKMIFQKFFWATLFGTVFSAIAGIVVAYKGGGVWALVVQYLSNTTIDTLVLFISINKYPGLRFSFKRFRTLFAYGIRILGTGLLIHLFVEMRALIIGKIYSRSELAYYDKGKLFPNVLVANISTSIAAVLFPKLANEQNDRARIKKITQYSVRFSSYLMSPIMLGFAAVAYPFVRFVLTEKWLPSVPLMRLFCIVFLFNPIHTSNSQAIKAIGRSDVYLKLEIIKKSIELVTLIITMNISVQAIVIGMAICTTGFTFVNAYPNKKFIDYSYKEQMLDIIPNILMGVIMSVIVYLVGMIQLDYRLLLLIQIIVGVALYIGMSYFTGNPEYKYIINYLRKRNTY